MNLQVLGMVSGKAVSKTGEVSANFQKELGDLMGKHNVYYLQVLLTPKEKKPETEPEKEPAKKDDESTAYN